MRFLALLALSALLGGCGTAEEGEAAEGKDTTASITEPAIWYRRYTGTVGSKPVVVHLHRWPGGWVEGSYTYASAGKPISLYRSYEDTAPPTNGTYSLAEDDRSGPLDVRDAGGAPRWSLRLDGPRGTGRWIGVDGTSSYAIELREDYGPDALRLRAIAYEDSAALLPDRAKPMAHAAYRTVAPAGGGALSPFIEEEIKARLEIKASGSLEEGLRGLARTYFADYRSSLDSEARAAISEDLDSYWMAYEESRAVSVLLNDRGWLVLESNIYTYTGGAHGYGASGFLNIDTRGKRTWGLADVVADTAALRPFITAAARSRIGMEEGVTLRDHYFVACEEIPPTANFYVTPTGLCFVYNPYEIASYAEGQVHLFLPYNRVQMLLTDAFKARMGLGRAADMRG